MRPVKLVMTAFGPFSSTQVINFEQLGKHPLFLINGPTGSGKTTILDAICFALYGQTTGDEREGSQMRSDHAAPDCLTEVTLTFELAGNVYRIRRVPEQNRPKSRGEGETRQPAQAQLWAVEETADDRLIVAAKVTEATLEIEQLTGLNADQFRQVMVLPQGKFRELLMAESKQREQIFSQLFQTQIYKQIELRLKQQALDISAKVKSQQQVYLGVMESAGLDAEQDLVTVLQQINQEAEQAKVIYKQKEESFVQCSLAKDQAIVLQQAFDALAKDQSRQAQLDARREFFDQKRQQLIAAEQASRLTPQFAELMRYRQSYERGESELVAAISALDAARLELKLATQAQVEGKDTGPMLDALKQSMATLEGYYPRLNILRNCEAAWQESLRDQQEGAKKIGRCQEKQEDATRKRKANEAQQRVLQQALLPFSKRQEQLVVSADQLAIKQEAELLALSLTESEQALAIALASGKTLGERLVKCERDVKQIELAWHQGQAALLAKELQPDKPCPVCGSLLHPAPTHAAQSLPSQTDIDQARSVLQELQESLAQAREAYAATKQRTEGISLQSKQLQDRLGEAAKHSLPQMQKQYDELKVTVDQLQENQKQLSVLQAELMALQRAEEQARSSLEQAKIEDGMQQGQLDKAVVSLSTAQQELPEAYRQGKALEQEVHQHQAKIGALETKLSNMQGRFNQASGQLEAAVAIEKAANQRSQILRDEMVQANSDWKATLSASSFASETAFQQALLGDEQTAALREEINHYDSECLQVKGAVDQQKRVLSGKPPPDMLLIEQQMNQAKLEHEIATTVWQDLDKRRGLLLSIQQRLDESDKIRQALEQEYALIGTLSDLANGQSGDKVSLQRFVLSVLLDDVLVEASHRLSLMSKGRYQLLRKEERSKGNKASGLELEVVDAYTGKMRSVSTLSGGESFIAALSLALGLSDVVQAYAGGIRLDTLFIDEGFGSLDAESLELAIRTLMDLQASGRMVGVISHVGQLKEQFTTRIDLLSDNQGSVIKLSATA